MKSEGIPQKTPLYSSHERLRARMVDFSGWLLPVQYNGIISEHNHTRESCSVFDICHMGEFLIEGTQAQEDLSHLLTVNIESMKPGICRYGFLLNEDGTFIDDSILYKYSDEKFMLVVNASRTETDLLWIKDNISEYTILTDISASTAKIDLQGPLSIEAANTVFPHFDFSSLKRFSFSGFNFRDTAVTVSATGYTGEKGFEFFLPSDSAEVIWDELLLNESVKPAGLGARDSLRLEKGFSLYGHDIDATVNPYEANLERFIDTNRNFIGAAALRKLTPANTERRLVPFICEGRRSARDGYIVYNEGESIGHVTSGAFSPVLKKGIGLCLIRSEFAIPGSSLVCVHEGVEIKAVVSSLPFV